MPGRLGVHRPRYIIDLDKAKDAEFRKLEAAARREGKEPAVADKWAIVEKYRRACLDARTLTIRGRHATPEELEPPSWLREELERNP